jgi:hypothetical protein
MSGGSEGATLRFAVGCSVIVLLAFSFLRRTPLLKTFTWTCFNFTFSHKLKTWREKLRVIFMQDRAPPHFSLAVRGAFNEKFPNAWIGRGGPIPWPPRSPDFNPMDCLSWGYVENCVYGEKIRDLQHLRDTVATAIATVTSDII